MGLELIGGLTLLYSLCAPVWVAAGLAGVCSEILISHELVSA